MIKNRVVHECQQGSDAWRALRTNHFTASEAPAMLGVSKYITRTDLIKQKSLGFAADVDPGTQRRFDAGHAAEAAARPHVEKMVGEELYPVTMTADVDGLPLLASMDGLTLLGEAGWETKLLNQEILAAVASGNLPEHYTAQMEQQMMVSGCERIFFTTSDGTPENTAGMWYVSDPALRSRIISGWKQFSEDLANYMPERETIKPGGKAPETLPALLIEVTGMVTASNLPTFKRLALEVFSGINTDLQTDEDFADAEKAVKWCGEVESRLDAAKQHALSQTSSIDELFRTLDAIKAEARTKRLDLDRLVKARKDAIRVDLVRGGIEKLEAHVKALNARIGNSYMPIIPADFGGVIKSKRTIASLRDAIDTELARAKIAANEIADRIQLNLAVMNGIDSCLTFLFMDLSQIVQKDPSDFSALVRSRIADFQDAQAKRIEKKEESDRIARAVVEEDRQRLLAQLQAEQRPQHEAVFSRQASTTIKLGEISARLGFTITADFLTSLGFPPHSTERAAKLYLADNFAPICAALVRHINAIQTAA